MEIEADDVSDALVEVAIEYEVLREGDKLSGGNLGGCSKDCVSSDYA